MSSVDLNIIERGLKGQQWTAEKGPITAGDLAKISEQRTNNSSALNALRLLLLVSSLSKRPFAVPSKK